MNKRIEIVGLRRDGTEFPIELAIGAIRWGEKHLFSAFVRDVTEQKRAQQELARKVEELARSNAELEQFAYVASHDLQEPLRMVASYTQLLARRYKGKLDSNADEFIGFAVDGAIRMQLLVQDLLSYSRVTTKGQSFQLIDAKAACANALENLRTSIKDSNAIVNVGPLPPVLADARQFMQLFQNLIGNAVKYCDERTPEIHVAAKPDGDQWLLITHLIVTLAHHLNLKVVAEGIETRSQLTYLQQFGCEFGQGYLFSRPVDHAALEKLLASASCDPVEPTVKALP